MVVATNRNQEKDDLHVVEDVNPLLLLGPLPAYVEHAVCEVSELEDGFCDTRGP